MADIEKKERLSEDLEQPLTSPAVPILPVTNPATEVKEKSTAEKIPAAFFVVYVYGMID